MTAPRHPRATLINGIGRIAADHATDAEARAFAALRVPWHVPACALVFAFALASPLAAQSVRGTLMRPDSTPAVGVIVVASRGARDSVLARTMTNGTGRYAMDMAAGAVRLRALRIGHRPVVIGEFNLAARETREMRTVLPDDPIVLQAVTTQATSVCRQKGAVGANVATVFEEARKALLSTMLTSSDGNPRARLSEHAQVRSLGARDLAPLQREFKEGESLKPFQSLPPDSLAKVGYMQRDPVGKTYWAPDADVLLSEAFAASHCLGLVEGTGEEAGWIGLTFRPQDGRPRFVDVSGTLWLDYATNELRRLDFRYEGLPVDERRLATGGRVEFTRLTSGTWFVSRWEIRMPFSAPPLGSTRRAMVLVKGGEVWRMRRGEALLFTNGLEEPVATPDAASTKAAVEVDVAAARAACAPTPDDAAAGVLRGTVRDALGAPLADAVVTVEWKENHGLTASGVKGNTRQLTTMAWSDGTFTVCGIPDARLLEVSAQFGARESYKVAMRIAKGERSTQVDLQIGGVRADATARGVVVRVRDPNGVAIPHAIVEVQGGRGRVTDDSGRVALRVAADSIRVAARRIGYAPLWARLGRSTNGEFELTMSPLGQSLATVTVVERGVPSPLERNGFYDRVQRAQRGAFTAEFITPEELDSRNVSRVTDLFSNRRFAFATRAPGSRSQTILVGRRGCKASVFLDGRLLVPEVPSGENRNFDLTDPRRIVPLDDILSAGAIAAVEIYASAAQAPGELIPLTGAAQEGSCAVVAIWTGGRH